MPSHNPSGTHALPTARRHAGTLLGHLADRIKAILAALQNPFTTDRHQSQQAGANQLAELEKRINQLTSSLAAAETTHLLRDELRSESKERSESVEALRSEVKEIVTKADKTSNHLTNAIWAYSIVLCLLTTLTLYNLSCSVSENQVRAETLNLVNADVINAFRDQTNRLDSQRQDPIVRAMQVFECVPFTDVDKILVEPLRAWLKKPPEFDPEGWALPLFGRF